MNVLRHLHVWYVPALIFCAGTLVGWLVPMEGPFTEQQIVNARGAVLRQSSSHFPLIDPLLACEIGAETTFPELAPLKKKLSSVIDEKKKDATIQNISVYVRTLQNSHWMEIGDETKYAPASLLKVFIMMAYYKEANETDNPGLFQRRIKFETKPDSAGETPGEVIPHLVAGAYYPIDTVIRQMIIYSDNDALDTLVDNFDPDTLKYYELIFTDLDIPSPITQNENSVNFMSIDEYSTIFRVLYSSTFLSERYSQRALALLSEAHYKGGVVAGVPEGVTVAHKFGITTDVADSRSAAPIHQLHDCGIVYYPGNPYLICVMTKGENFGALQDAISSVSGTAYQWFAAYYAHPASQ